MRNKRQGKNGRNTRVILGIITRVAACDLMMTGQGKDGKMKNETAIVKSAKDLKPNEVYYQPMTIGGTWASITYDEDLQPVRVIDVRYIDAIKDLQRVIKIPIDMVTKEFYTLEPINNQYYKVMKNETTSDRILAHAETLNTWKR